MTDKTLMQVLADGFIAWQNAPRRGRRAEYEYVHDAILANPDAVLRNFTVVQAMEAHGWNRRMIGAAMDARYEGMG